MKLEIELSKAEAQKVLGNAIKSTLVGTSAERLEIAVLDWDRYGARVTITLEEPVQADPAAEVA